jgi:hypothetical protein
LVVILIIEVDDLGAVDPERDAPVASHKQAPRTFAITGHLVRFPAWHSAQFAFLFHILQEGDDLADL